MHFELQFVETVYRKSFETLIKIVMFIASSFIRKMGARRKWTIKS